jgi:ketosteroid isomerase-like protein
MKKTAAVVAAIVAVLALLFIATEQTAPPEMTEAEIAQVEAEVRQELINRMDEFKEDAMSGDAESVMSFLTSDYWVLMPGVNLAGEDLRAVVAEVYSTMTFTDINAELLELFVHGSAAYGIYEYSVTSQMEGQDPVTEISNCFIRWEKEDGVWKFDREVCGPRDAPTEG